MPENEFSGIFPYLVTPLDESGNLKEGVLRDLVNHLISKGVHGLTPLGSTGEGAYLSWEVKKKVVEVVVKAAAGRVPVIAGVNDMTTNGAVKQAKETERLGADGILVVLPTYFPLADQQVVEHFRTVARAVSCPVILYTNPKFAKWDFTVDTLRQLAEEANIRYLKDASGNIGKLMSIVTALGDRFKIFSATAHVPVFVLMLGGVGWMAGPACLIPEQSIALYELACQKRWVEALEFQKKLWPLNMAFQRYSLAACVKAGLEMQGFPVGPPLPPQQQLNEEEKRVVSQILTTIGVL
ncbi:MAG TPA: dihydrodipicolinate synthase family protein [Deltaproteobacteria bacterium]|nr:dihydrodipicolinate synthase family protein [Deltaproteobacteria bacterium]